jgi:cytosine/adenosine deaminase-related metal-dependent hydrolase
MTGTEIFAERAWAQPGEAPLRRDVRITIDGARVASLDDAAPRDAGKGRGRIVVPAPANAHDHGRAIPTVAFGADDQALELWIPSLVLSPAAPPYLLAAVAFARLVRAGVTSVVHFHGPQDAYRMADEAAEFCRAARDVGIRLAFVVRMHDRNRLAYGADEEVLAGLAPADRDAVLKIWRAPLPDLDRQLAMVDEIEARSAGGLVTVQYGPSGLQWCSDGFLERIARAASDRRRGIQAHLLETWYQRVWLDRAYPGGVIRRMDELGLLSPRTSFAHGVWLRPDEMALLAERGATVALNASSNLRLRSGRAQAAALQDAGVPLGMGLDSSALDLDDDPWREIRLQRVIHGGTGIAGGLTLKALATAAFTHGHKVAGSEALHGQLAPGASADLVALDWAAIGADSVDGVTDEVELLLGRASERHVRDVWIAGRRVVEDGRVTGVDLPALEAELRQIVMRDAPRLNAMKPVVSRWQAHLRDFYAKFPAPAAWPLNS